MLYKYDSAYYINNNINIENIFGPGSGTEQMSRTPLMKMEMNEFSANQPLCLGAHLPTTCLGRWLAAGTYRSDSEATPARKVWRSVSASRSCRIWAPSCTLRSCWL